MLPIERPGKIVCIGLNYRDHAEEQGAALPSEPLLFAKWPNALVGPGDPIVIPPFVTQCDYEAELGVVVGSRVKGVSVIWTFFGSYLVFRFGSVDLAIGVGCEERYSGLTAKCPAVGCDVASA